MQENNNNNNNIPVISIITVCYNSVKTLEETIQSVIKQTYSNIEYIIIDGGSTDGTVDIIKKYEDKIAYWVSEPDKGIYDAMNKGIGKTKGDYIYFLGSDDYLYNDNVLKKVSEFIAEHNDGNVFCGQILVLDRELGIEIKHGQPFTLDDVLVGYMSPHQGMFVKRELLKKYLFNTEYKLSADFDFFLKTQLNREKTYYLNNIIAFFSLGGSSGIFSKKTRDECAEILSVNTSADNLEKFNKKRIEFEKRSFWMKIIKRLLKWFGILKYIQCKRGWQKHKCNNIYCRICKEYY